MRTVLVVEDDPDIRQSLQDVLEAEGYQVFAAEDGQEGLATLRRIDGPCLILLDLMMPVMSGAEFLGELRQSEELGGLPVVIVSAWSEASAGLTGQVQDFVKKPVSLDRLLEAVDQHCPPA